VAQILPIAGALLLGVAQLGFIGALRRTARVPTAVAPAVAVALQLILAFACGLAGALSLAPFVIVGVGGFLLGIEVRRGRQALLGHVIDPSVVVLAVLTAALVWILPGARLLHYDNFSHWGLVVRFMLRQDRFPTATDTIVGFHTYPLGTASWEYAVARLLGGREWQMMLAQGYILATACVSILALTPRRRWAGLVGVAALVVAFLLHGPRLDTLLVDNVLAAWTIVGLVTISACRGNVGRAAFPLAVLCAALVATKQTGVFWVIVLCLTGLVLRAASPWQRALSLLAPALGAGLTWAAWRRHTATTFAGLPDSKHSFSREQVREMLAEKTPEVRAQIHDLFLTAVRGDQLLWLALAGLALALAVAGRVRHRPRRAAVAMGGAALVSVLFLGGQYAVYVLSMPAREALQLASFDRYLSTLHLVLAAAALIVGAHLAEQARPSRSAGAFVMGLGGVVSLLITSWPRPLWSPVDGTLRDRVESAFATVSVPPGSEICLYGDHPSGYLRYLVRYVSLADDVVSTPVPDRAGWPIPPACDYVAVVDRSPRAAAYLRASGYPVTDTVPVVMQR